jgi:hypothetical protein
MLQDLVLLPLLLQYKLIEASVFEITVFCLVLVLYQHRLAGEQSLIFCSLTLVVYEIIPVGR